MDTPKSITPSQDPELTMLIGNRDSGINYKERKSSDWRENYELYRDRVQVNRLIQRQSVHIPLMKQTIRTLLKDVDDMPVIYFENLDSDKQKELFMNEYWKWTLDMNNMEIKDIADKKQDMFFGRSFDQMQIKDGRVEMNIIDPEDILVSRYTDPTDLDTSRFLVHTHIYVPLSTLEQTREYDQEAIKDLKIWYGTEQGLIKSDTNKSELDEKNKRLSDLGILDAYDPILGETYVELSMHFVYRDKDEQLYLYVEAEQMRILMKKPLEEVIGVTEDHYWRNHFPYNSWADDVDMQDFWTDGVADITRTPNKILDVWFSQLVENRTLRSFGMTFYNSNLEGFNPTTWQPIPFGMYGVPIPANSDIRQNMQRVEIPDLTESLDEMKYVQEVTQLATGANVTQAGGQVQRKVTLGEVQLALNESKSRIKGMSKFYTKVWEQRAKKFLKLIEAAPDKLEAVTIFKKGRNTDTIYSKEIGPEDWKSKLGYRTKIWSQDEKDEADMNTVEKLNIAMSNMPGNPILKEEFERKLLELAKLPPDKIVEIVEAQKRMDQNAAMAEQAALSGGMGAAPVPGPTPVPFAPAPKKPITPQGQGTNEAVSKLKNIGNKLA